MYDISETLPESMIVSFLEADEDCVVDLDLVLQLGIYTRKDTAVKALKRNFVEGVDYSVSKRSASTVGGLAFVYFLTSDCFKSICMMAETEFGREVRKYYLTIERRWRESQKQSQVPYYYRRLQVFSERTGKIPAGYFCIFKEITHLIEGLEQCGHLIEDDAIIDISVGKLFCKYLREECDIEPNNYCLQYPHFYPGRNKPVMANLYPIDWLTTFRKWFDFTYCTHHLERYFKGRKDAPGILAVNKFLGLLPAN